MVADHPCEQISFCHKWKQITKALRRVWAFKALSLLVFHGLHNSSLFAVYYNSILGKSN